MPDSFVDRLFTTFARAFFADRSRISMAELIKSFHFYYLSNDAGLIYEHLDDDYERSLLAPLREHLSQLGVVVHTNREVSSVVCGDDGRYEIDWIRKDGSVLNSLVAPQPLYEGGDRFAGSVAVMLLTGIPLFLSESVKCYYSEPFWLKMTALPVALLFTGEFTE